VQIDIGIAVFRISGLCRQKTHQTHQLNQLLGGIYWRDLQRSIQIEN
jgi:hypothetical protein